MLSKIMMGKPNVLLIDEPTNHLDLESITAFNNSLINFKGTVLLSTNDRAFAESVANRIIEITPNGIIDSYLTFSEYIVDENLIKDKEFILELVKISGQNLKFAHESLKKDKENETKKLENYSFLSCKKFKIFFIK